MNAPRYGPGIEVTAQITPEFAQILTPDALAFAARLQRAFGARRTELLARRVARQVQFDAGVIFGASVLRHRCAPRETAKPRDCPASQRRSTTQVRPSRRTERRPQQPRCAALLPGDRAWLPAARTRAGRSAQPVGASSRTSDLDDFDA